ncbi:MAG: prolipoprotein diacylglyceryl transferase [Bdellovibrionaceae bacterium]|nr:prolipoprotein diacylglyceryl transferase [Pseudobdellovibrionaceae bacterium]
MFPFIHLAQGVLIPTYFLVISLAYMICTLWLYMRADQFQLSHSHVLDLCLIIMVSGFLGARLLHVIYEHPDYYFKVPSQIFKFWQGGFVFYGGLLASILASLYFLKFKKQNIPQWMDLLAPVIVFGYIIGRFATLLSGSGYGHPTNLPWAIVYPPGPEAPSGIPLHPTPIYSILWNSLALIFILIAQKKSLRFFSFKGSYLLAYGVYHGIGRLIIEQFRDDFRGSRLLGLSVSSWISVILIICCIFIYAKMYKSRSIS